MDSSHSVWALLSLFLIVGCVVAVLFAKSPELVIGPVDTMEILVSGEPYGHAELVFSIFADDSIRVNGSPLGARTISEVLDRNGATSVAIELSPEATSGALLAIVDELLARDREYVVLEELGRARRITIP